MKDLLKINYDNYYKFLVSTGLIAIVIIVLATTYLHTTNLIDGNISILISFGLLGFSIMVGYGLFFWNKRQKIHDKILELEFEMLDNKIREKKILIKRLNLDMKREEMSKEQSDLTLKEFKGKDISGEEE